MKHFLLSLAYLWIATALSAQDAPAPGCSIPTLDLSTDTTPQVVVDRERKAGGICWRREPPIHSGLF